MTAGPLFSFDYSEDAIQVGEIVRQAWPWTLSLGGRCYMPFWQVRAVSVWYGKRTLHCLAVPFTIGCCRIQVFTAEDLVRTGKSWRVPTDAELQGWFKDLGTTLFVADLNSRCDGAPHPAEAELVALVESLGPIKLPVSDKAFYEAFPSPTREEIRAKRRAAAS